MTATDPSGPDPSGADPVGGGGQDRSGEGRGRAGGGLPLSGVVVIEAATFLSGPLAGQALADLGASVTKVEPPDGDAMRRFGRTVEGLSVMWVAANRTRTEEVRLDLAGAAGRAALDRMCEGADVLLTNWRPGVAERLGLTPRRVRERWPRLVWCRISGFGQRGPRASEPAFDGVIQAASGAMPTQGAGGVGDRPEMVHAFHADKITASHATQAVLAGLVQRAATGSGSVVDVAMLDAVAYHDFVDTMAERALPSDDGRGDGINLQLAAVRAVPTADGWMVVSPARRRHLVAALAVVGRADWAEELRKVDGSAAVTARWFELLATVSQTRSTASWLEAFRAADVPVAEVLDADGHLTDAQVLHNVTYGATTHPVIGLHRFVRHPARWH